MGAHHSKKFVVGWVWLLVVVGGVSPLTSIQASSYENPYSSTASDDQDYEQSAADALRAQMGSDPSTFEGAAVYFDAESNFASSELIVTLSSIDESEQSHYSCRSFESAECSASSFSSTKKVLLRAKAMLGLCRDISEIGCIEEVKISRDGSDFEGMELVGFLGEETVFEENKDLSIPRGSSRSLWKNKNNENYVISAGMQRMLVPENGRWVSRVGTQFEFQINRIASNGSSRLRLLKNTNFAVKVRLPNVVSGWFESRIQDGLFGSTQLVNNRTVYEFRGGAAPVIVAGGAVKFLELDDEFLKKFYPSSTKTNGLTFRHNPGEGGASLFFYEQWLPYLEDKSLTTVNQWIVRSTGWPNSNVCFSALTGVTGFISTNAAVYNGLPPTWDATTGSLGYQVAAPHYDENGQVNVGTYTLSMPVAAAKCLYGASILPPTVDVTVGAEGATPDFATTLGLTELNGWLNLSVKGFHYSSPTIKVKLGKASLGSAANGLLTVKVNKKLTARSIAGFAGLSVKSTSKVKLVVSKASRTRCAIQGATLVAKATGRCTVTITVTPKRGKPVKKTVSVTVTGPPTITRSITASAKAIAEHAKLEVLSSSKISLKVAKSSAKTCRVSGSKVKGLKKGTCRVTVEVTSVSVIVQSKTVNLKVT